MHQRKVKLSGGEKLLWQGRQWVVTSRGMRPAASQMHYWIGKERLAEARPFSAGVLADWPLHMAEKDWVDIEDFLQVWVKACKLHHTDLGRINVALSIKEARELSREDRAAQEGSVTHVQPVAGL
jgi:hypothetical protein